MFEFLKANRDENSYVDLIELICQDIDKLELSKVAFNKAVNMISNAVAKSFFEVWQNGEGKRSELTYRLNVMMNDNQPASRFWQEAVSDMITQRECLIVPIKEKFYLASTWRVSSDILKPKTYSEIVIKSDGEHMKIMKQFKAGDVMHIKVGAYGSYANVLIHLKKVYAIYDSLASNLSTAIALAGLPKFRFDMAAKGRLVSVDENGNEVKLTKDMVAQKYKTLLESDKLQILNVSEGMTLSQIEIKTTATTNDMKTLRQEINEMTATAFDIPIHVFNGTVTEKADSTNEFITFAVSPYVEAINDAANACLIGMEDWIKGEDIQLCMRQYKHVDLIESAANLSALRGIGFNLDEIRESTGYHPLGTEFSTARALTKNYMSETDGKEKNSDG